jgi:probable F420-dependent oxidoreductase
MRIDGPLAGRPSGVEAEARRYAGAGYSGIFASELAHDPFLTAALAGRATSGIHDGGEHTGRTDSTDSTDSAIDIGTEIAVAFARNPMTVATTARDLQDLTGGRFILGLGTQVEAHITRRFSMPWSHPAARMEEFVSATRAIWHAWNTGERLQFRGEFYTHTLMTPVFSPEPLGYPDPRIWLAAVGERMVDVAARVADGLVLHSFCSALYFERVIRPVVDNGLAESGRARAHFEISIPAFAVCAETDEAFDAQIGEVRARLAFYGSTPSYRAVLAVHGWEDLADELHRLSVGRDPERWSRMSRLITDDVLAQFAVIAAPADFARAVADRYTGVADRVSLQIPPGVTAETWRDIVSDLQRPGQ